MFLISTEFFLIRHGETDWNKPERFRGRSDIGLNANGKRQAEKIAARLARAQSRPVAVYSSPLTRAIETADPIARVFGLVTEARAELLDIDYGGWEGLSVPDVEEKFPELYQTWLRRPGHVKFPGGESTRQVRVRIENLFSDLGEKHRGENVVLISHRITCHVALCYALGLNNDNLWRMGQDIGCINIIELREEDYVVRRMNDLSHLME